MNYLLDTNIISDLYNSESANHFKIAQRFSGLAKDDTLAVSILAFYEMEYALQNAPEHKKQRIKQGIDNIAKNFLVLPLSVQYAEKFGLFKKQIKDDSMANKENIKKHNIDIMLASCAICEAYVLVSADKIYHTLKQFNHRLVVEDWSI